MITSIMVFVAALAFVAMLACVTAAYVARESGPKAVNRLAMLLAVAFGMVFIGILGALAKATPT